MFTGLIAEIGVVEAVSASVQGARLTVAAELADELRGGDSIAVDGVCLTVVAAGGGRFEADLMNQTLALTALAGVEPGRRVNLEPAMRAGDRFGGHIVQGHVDGTGELVAVSEDGFARRLEVALSQDLLRYVAEHGSIALDGTSLTVARVAEGSLEVSLIPETLARTTLGEAEEGRLLNVEVDLIARYAERLLQGFGERTGPQ